MISTRSRSFFQVKVRLQDIEVNIAHSELNLNIECRFLRTLVVLSHATAALRIKITEIINLAWHAKSFSRFWEKG